MSEKFDPYHQWLGIAASEQPPHHYRLLSIPLFEESPAVIENAANQRMAHLRTFQTGKHVNESQRLLNEVATARICLLSPQKKGTYDQSLRQRLAASAPAREDTQAKAFDPDFSAILDTRKPSVSGIGTKGRRKKPHSKPTALIAALGAAVVVLATLGLWLAFANNNTPSDGEIAKAAHPGTVADLAPAAKSLKDGSAKSAAPSVQHTPVVTTNPAKSEPIADESKADDLKAAPDPKQPEPKTAKEAKVARISDTIAVANPVTKDPEASKAVSRENRASGEQQTPKKLAPPSAEEQKRLMGEIDEVYKPGAAKDQAAKAALAHRLLEDGRKNESNRAEQFVVLRRAGELARDAGETDVMLEAVDAIAAAGFDIQPFQVKARLLKQLVAQSAGSGASRISTIAESCVKFASEAAASGATGEASDVLDAAGKSFAKPFQQAQTAARIAKAAAARARPADKAERQKKAADAEAELEAIKSAQTSLSDCTKALQKAIHERDAIQAARLRLKTSPDDPEACLTVGRWYCFHEGDWGQGLKFLAKGSDAGLKSVAAEELASKPAKPEERVARGDAWWNLAEKATGKVKAAMQRRAGQWYDEAMPDLASGLTRTKVENRLAQVPKEGAAEAEAPAPISTAIPPLAKAPFDEKTAKSLQARWAKFLRVPIVETNSLGMKLTLIPPGQFEMGTSQEVVEAELKEFGKDEWFPRFAQGQTPQHQVRITKPFWLGVTSVTQEQYQGVMGVNPSKCQGDPRRPVECVTGNQALEFCRRLSELPKEQAAGRQYHLPTEAQWEYACRAGNTGRWCFSERDPAKPFSRAAEEKLLGEYAWFNRNAGDTTHPIGQKRANAWGLYDMYGNVMQWCQDFFNPDYYANSPTDDPTGPAQDAFRPCRGGSWFLPPQYSCSGFRFHHPSAAFRHDVGFRVALGTIRGQGQGQPETNRAEQPLSHAATAAPIAEGYVGSKNSQLFHKPSCISAANIAPKNLVNYATRDEAVAKGKLPCHECNP